MLDTKSHLFKLRPDIEKKRINEIIRFVKKNISEPSLIIASSGTTESLDLKVYIIPHQKMLRHSEMIAKEFSINSKSVILNVLPEYFMGGLAPLYRQKVSGAKLVQRNWGRKKSEFDEFKSSFTHSL